MNLSGKASRRIGACTRESRSRRLPPREWQGIQVFPRPFRNSAKHSYSFESPPKESAPGLRLQRSQVSHNRNHVAVAEPRHGLFHQRAPWALACAVLKIVKLAEELAWRTACQARDRAEPLQLLAVAHAAGHRFSRAACGDQGFALL